jgi:hypothetical protein
MLLGNDLISREAIINTPPGDLANLEPLGDQNETCNVKVMDGLENPEDFYDKNYYLSLREKNHRSSKKVHIE